MPCWYCHKDVGAELQCAGCGALQPVPPGTGHFEVFGLAPTYFLDEKALEARFRDLNRRLHPDRFAQKSPRERRASLEWTTALTGAYRTLQDPLSRAVELLKRQGLEVEKESGAAQKLPAGFLEEVMELREGLSEAKASGNLGQVRALALQVAARKGAVASELGEQMASWEKSADRTALARAAERVGVLKYYRRFEDEVQAIEAEALSV